MSRFETRVVSKDEAIAFIQNMRWFAGHGRITAKPVEKGSDRYRERATRGSLVDVGAGQGGSCSQRVLGGAGKSSAQNDYAVETLAQYQRLIQRMHVAHLRYEKALVYRDDTSHEIIKGQAEYDAYALLKMRVEANHGAFPWIDPQYPD